MAKILSFSDDARHLLEHGVNLSSHESRPVTEELMENATDVYAMAESHLAALLANFPEHADKIRLVTCYTDNRSIADPIGCGQAAYNSVARQLAAAVQAIVARMEQQDDAEYGRRERGDEDEPPRADTERARLGNRLAAGEITAAQALRLGAAEVAARNVVALAGEGKRLRAIQALVAGVERHAAVTRIEAFGNINPNAAELVDHALQAIEVHLTVMRDRNARERRNRINRARRAAE